ncbi:hypothetical protein SDC9_203037 [bioreactor metagenome]|uniref:Uncharacterized protein n=1 Tax=bioreactor metagenome TaxID=1076179 RepID=A0A645IVA1_9ZZZZ
MAGYLRYPFGCIGYRDPPVTRGHAGMVSRVKAHINQLFSYFLRRVHAAPACGLHKAVQHFAVFIQYNRLGAGGAYIYSDIPSHIAMLQADAVHIPPKSLLF